eukprot:TRINITY_DN1743_c0_g1_i1.p1 TRINITY_DN1743_c0_g1~~TRINITY_DN1743_c0_g1_i1.p1  ORF type:complete len:208 (+),score=88.13 TRINITY_DN1743_c0_g1_i1:90-713(+)
MALANITQETYKVILLGHSGVGKTQLYNRFSHGEFSLTTKNTIGGDRAFCTFETKNGIIQMELWDTAGEEKYHALSTTIYRNASAIILVYDVTDKKSFDLTIWIQELKRYKCENLPILLLANKIDLSDRQVTIEEGQNLAKENNYLFCEVSAKLNINLESTKEQFILLMQPINIRSYKSKLSITLPKQTNTREPQQSILSSLCPFFN